MPDHRPEQARTEPVMGRQQPPNRAISPGSTGRTVSSRVQEATTEFYRLPASMSS